MVLYILKAFMILIIFKKDFKKLMMINENIVIDISSENIGYTEKKTFLKLMLFYIKYHDIMLFLLIIIIIRLHRMIYCMRQIKYYMRTTGVTKKPYMFSAP